jgi:hypothetical protein
MMASSPIPVFSFTVEPRRPKKRPEPPSRSCVPRLARLLALAHKLEGLVGNGPIHAYATLARLGHISRARLSQIMNLILLAPDIQEEILFLPSARSGRDPITLSRLQPLARIPSWARQRRLWRHLKRKLLRNPKVFVSPNDHPEPDTKFAPETNSKRPRNFQGFFTKNESC